MTLKSYYLPCINTWPVHVTKLTTSICFHIEIKLSKKVVKSHFKEPYGKQRLTLVVISYVIYKTRQRLVSFISDEIINRVSSSISATL